MLARLSGVVLLCFAALPVPAQQTTATLLGTVTDSTGAIMPNVTVRATNVATNAQREVKTDEGGGYSLPFLAAGDYTVTATLQGFQSSRVDRVTLQVQQTARLDFALNVGEVSETVNVEASAALLQTETSTVGTVIDAAKIADLPLNGRNFVQLAQLIPGVNAGTPGSISVRR
ncbi:MAG: carboxypeptidase regulatory-like domain-containing protein, partial [Bryobacteraceae bacterium]|nr:carboxypeptidase regulatory-like domain-containing protein [Bryobacteraceae bacterium]